jgi:formylglycine-generating enzyme required for sulfatase activity
MRSRLKLMMVTAVFATCLGCAEAGKAQREKKDAIAQADKEITNSIGMKLVLIPKGTFMMGSPESEEGPSQHVAAVRNEVQHQVTLSKNVYLGVTEVTQAQYQKVMGKNPSHFRGDRVQGDSSDHPVENVSRTDAAEFCRKLSELPEEQQAGRVYRLPTEAEWEYACRAGSKTAYSFGDERDSLGDYAWFLQNSDGKTHRVGERKPNAWGLYDMHGNIWEWCSDRYGEYSKGAVSDPTGPRWGVSGVLRGGSWRFEAEDCRTTSASALP